MTFRRVEKWRDLLSAAVLQAARVSGANTHLLTSHAEVLLYERNPHPQSAHRQVPEEFGNILVTGSETQTIHQILGLHKIVSSLLKGTVVKG